jgi:CBS domain containing-hemolysin-like protein
MDESESGDRRNSFWRNLFGLKRRRVSAEDELQELIELSERQGLINAEEGEMSAPLLSSGIPLYVKR